MYYARLVLGFMNRSKGVKKKTPPPLQGEHEGEKKAVFKTYSTISRCTSVPEGVIASTKYKPDAHPVVSIWNVFMPSLP